MENTKRPTRHTKSFAAYLRNGERMAYNLGNRGPIEFTSDGRLRKEILDAYWLHGFYVFEGVVGGIELEELQANLEDVINRAPHTRDAHTDAKGRPARLGTRVKPLAFQFEKPLSDPTGGLGRHPAKMAVVEVPEGAPEFVMSNIFAPLQMMDACLRLYGHPRLLSVVQAVNGPDFTPFNESVIVKPAGLGASVAWHQDGTTHWDNPDCDEGAHGFNFMFQYYGSTAANGVWVIPGSHKEGKVDIKGLVVTNGGSDCLPGAVPMVCDAGDVVMANRQTVHCSFANTSAHTRVTFNFGYHRRSWVLGAAKKGQEPYDEERIFCRSRAIAFAIDARHQRFPDESRYVYLPLAGQEDSNRWSEDTRETLQRCTESSLSL